MKTQRSFLCLCLLALAVPSAQQPSIDDFFRELSDGWVRLNPNIAVSTRYFSGDEQDRLERQISSYTDAAERAAARRTSSEGASSSRASIDRA